MSPVPAPDPVMEPDFSSATPSGGDTWIYNASSGQWEPGAGGGGDPFAGLAQTGVMTGVTGWGPDFTAVFNPESDAPGDGWWIVWPSPQSVPGRTYFGIGQGNGYDLDDPASGGQFFGATEHTGMWLQLQGPGTGAVSGSVYAQSYGDTTQIVVNSSTGQTEPLLDLNAGGIHPLRVTGDNKIGFFDAAAAARPTGVAVTAGGVHAALVTLGLIAA